MQNRFVFSRSYVKLCQQAPTNNLFSRRACPTSEISPHHDQGLSSAQESNCIQTMNGGNGRGGIFLHLYMSLSVWRPVACLPLSVHAFLSMQYIRRIFIIPSPENDGRMNERRRSPSAAAASAV